MAPRCYCLLYFLVPELLGEGCRGGGQGDSQLPGFLVATSYHEDTVKVTQGKTLSQK